MKRYQLLNLKCDTRIVVIATSYVSPLTEIYSIAHELKSINYKGEIIFDLVLSNGFASNRFLKMSFNGEQLDVKNVEILSKLKSGILDELSLFFYHNPQYVRASSLSESQKEVLLDKFLLGELT